MYASHYDYKRMSLVHRRLVGRGSEKPVSRKRRRLALAVERQVRRSRRGIIAGPSRSDRSESVIAAPLNPGTSLIVIILLSVGLWAAIWEAAVSLVTAVLR